MKFSLKLLGCALLEGADGPIRGRAAHKRRLAVLAVLAVARGRPVSRERLLGLLWPDSPSYAGRHSLSESLSVLRRELGDEVFLSVGDDLALDMAQVGCDLVEFEEALEAGDPAAAVARYGGMFMEGFCVSDAVEFERWAEGERDRVGRLYSEALGRLAAEAEAAGDASGAARWWRRLAVYDPYSSRVALGLVRALHAIGEPEGALRHAAVHAAFLREELGTEPASELQAYVEKVRREAVPADTVAAQHVQSGEARSPRPVAEVAVDLGGEEGTEGTRGVTPPGLAAPIEGASDERTEAPRADAPAPAVALGANGEGAAHRTTAVWYADYVGYSARLARDHTAAEAILEIFQSTVLAEVRRGGGHVMEFLGDGVLAEFPDVASAARASVRLVHTFERRTREAGSPATVRAGLHTGIVHTTDDGGIYGEAVSVASSLKRRAAAGQVIVSGDVRARLLEDTEFDFAARGVVVVQGVAASVSVYDLHVEAPPMRREAPRFAGAPPSPPAAWLVPGFVALVLALALSAVAMLRTSDPAFRRGGVDAPRAAERIAVLYFTPQSPDPSLRALAAGLTDQLIHELAQIEVLDVVPPSGVRPYRDSKVPLDSVAAALRAGTLLDGTLESVEGRLKLRLYLIDAASGERLRSTVLHARAGHPFDLEEQLAGEAARFLRWRLGRDLEVRTHISGTRSERARELVLLAEQAREDARTMVREPDSIRIALGRRLLGYADSLLRRAEAADPRWAEPASLRGWVAVERSAHSPAAEEARLIGEALVHAHRALRLRPGDPRALELRGSIRWRLVFLHTSADSADRVLAGAHRDIEAAVDADPRRASAWSLLSQILRVRGDHEGAYFAAERAYRSDAYLLRADQVRYRLFRSALNFGRFDLAEEQCSSGAREFPTDWRFAECRLVILAWTDTGRVDAGAAETALGRVEALDPPAVARADGRAYLPVYRRMLWGVVLARAGARDSARAVMARARTEVGNSPEARASFAYDEAHLRLALGDRTGAVRALRTLLELQPLMRLSVASDYNFRSLRADPSFRALVTPG